MEITLSSQKEDDVPDERFEGLDNIEHSEAHLKENEENDKSGNKKQVTNERSFIIVQDNSVVKIPPNALDADVFKFKQSDIKSEPGKTFLSRGL